MVVLATPIVPSSDSELLARMLDIGLNEEGFFAPNHNVMNRFSSTFEGIEIAGTAEGPKDIGSSVTQGVATAGKLLSRLVPGRKLEIETVTAYIEEDTCGGCRLCIAVCPYGAIGFDDESRVSVVNEVLCKGCGTCVSACPTGAAKAKHFSGEQIDAEIKEVLS